uniref:7TM_GPCR_Srx domain-containing protein n=1 Tax=Rhabditophanes sp. KR3021 TaxID=114890 RepID=A0AC35TW53_9BILA
MFMFCIAMACSCIVAGLFFGVMHQDYRNDAGMVKFVMSNGIVTEETKNQVFLRTNIKDPFFLTCLLIITAFFSVNYFVITFCILRVNKTLSVLSSNFNEKTKRMHAELNRLMIIQVLLPFIFTSGQMLFCITSMILELRSTGLGIIDMIMISFLPAVNASCVLMNSKSYWKNMFDAIKPPRINGMSFNPTRGFVSSRV